MCFIKLIKTFNNPNCTKAFNLILNTFIQNQNGVTNKVDILKSLMTSFRVHTYIIIGAALLFAIFLLFPVKQSWYLYAEFDLYTSSHGFK